MTILSFFLVTILFIWLIATVAGCYRPMARGLSVASSLLPADHLVLLTDLTYRKAGNVVCEQQILPEVLRLISEAESFIILDIFLYNDLQDGKTPLPPLSRNMTQALLAAKHKRPDLHIWLITDPANTGYGSYTNPYFEELEAAGITVVLTNLDRLPNSNLFYAGFWNMLGIFLSRRGRAMLPSAFYPDSPRFSLGGWLALFNFKANHRKVVLTEKAGLVTSANNSHDASAANSNIAFAFSGPLLADLLKSEQAAARLSGYNNLNLSLPPSPEANAEVIKLQLLTEAKIKEVLLDDLDHCQPPATIWIAMFYLADRQVIAALLAAARRGVVVNLILDANRDAFGHHKNGVPNKPVAAWLKKKSGDGLQIRWYDSHGEQFHSKLVMLTSPERTMVMGGSANLTRRNIAGFNLETCLRIIGPPEHAFNQQVLSYFLRLWNNEGGNFTLEYETCADANLLKYLQYQVQERTGLSSF